MIFIPQDGEEQRRMSGWHSAFCTHSRYCLFTYLIMKELEQAPLAMGVVGKPHCVCKTKARGRGKELLSIEEHLPCARPWADKGAVLPCGKSFN